jgi:hypothetical protein
VRGWLGSGSPAAEINRKALAGLQKTSGEERVGGGGSGRSEEEPPEGAGAAGEGVEGLRLMLKERRLPRAGRELGGSAATGRPARGGGPTGWPRGAGGEGVRDSLILGRGRQRRGQRGGQRHVVRGQRGVGGEGEDDGLNAGGGRRGKSDGEGQEVAGVAVSERSSGRRGSVTGAGGSSTTRSKRRREKA